MTKSHYGNFWNHQKNHAMENHTMENHVSEGIAVVSWLCVYVTESQTSSSSSDVVTTLHMAIFSRF